MKYLIVSDVHGSVKYLKLIKEISLKEHVNDVIFLGDMFSYGGCYDDELLDILNSFNNKVVIKGNCDSELDMMVCNFYFVDHYIFEFNNKKIYCTHGNVYNISNIPSCDFDIMFSGHTHRSSIVLCNKRVFCNPGSCSLPRGDSTNSFIIMNDDGIFIKDFDNNIIDKYLF